MLFLLHTKVSSSYHLCEKHSTQRWFGGVPTLAIRGECACPEGTFFDEDDMACNDVPPFGFGLLTIIGIIIAVIVTACCCVCCFFGKKVLECLKKSQTTDTQ